MLDRREAHFQGRTLKMVRRVAVGVAGLYLLFAAVGRFVEGMGAVQCGCTPACWCKRPILSTFRWTFPWAHHQPAHG